MDIGFQSLYLDPTASWDEKIVCHDPIFTNELSGVAALKSLRLERCQGLVLKGAKPSIRLFRKELKEQDDSCKLGDDVNESILSSILQLAKKHQLIPVYRQNAPQEVGILKEPLEKVATIINRELKQISGQTPNWLVVSSNTLSCRFPENMDATLLDYGYRKLPVGNILLKCCNSFSVAVSGGVATLSFKDKTDINYAFKVFRYGT
jgi:hypothetical protein